MAPLVRITSVEPLGDHHLRLTFGDGLVRELDLSQVVDAGGVFEPLRDADFFAQVSIDGVAGTICWPNGVDLDPDVLHGDGEPVSGVRYRVLSERRMRQAG
jgi:hypothetical protein